MQVTSDTVQHGQFPHPFENNDTIFLVEVFSDLAYELCYFVDIEVNHILEKYPNLVQ